MKHWWDRVMVILVIIMAALFTLSTLRWLKL